MCGTFFLSTRRETGICSHSCVTTRKWQEDRPETLATLRAAHQAKKVGTREQQLDIYTQVKFELGRVPKKIEWAEACQKQDISIEISRESSPFRFYKDLQEAAEMHNHRVLSVELAGSEDVYNGTVDEFHNFFVGGWQSSTRNKKRKWTYLNNLQCGEVFLRPMQFCNLSIVIARPDDTYETLKEKVEVATIIGTIQSMATHFPGLRADWKKNNVEERLLGVDINGQMDSIAARDPEIQSKLRQAVLDTNAEYAQLLDIKLSASTTCVKPSGNSSQLFNCSSGVHARWSKYYIRNVRVGAFTPLYKVLRDTGVPMDPENGQSRDNADTWVVHFPVKAPDDAITRDKLSASEQCDYWLQIKTNWTEHNPSVTITFQENEVLDLIKWVWEHQDVIGGMTFLPHFDAKYSQMPFTEITEDEYNEKKENFPEIDFSKIYRYELEDYTTVAQELACFAGGCEE